MLIFRHSHRQMYSSLEKAYSFWLVFPMFPCATYFDPHRRLRMPALAKTSSMNGRMQHASQCQQWYGREPDWLSTAPFSVFHFLRHRYLNGKRERRTTAGLSLSDVKTESQDVSLSPAVLTHRQRKTIQTTVPPVSQHRHDGYLAGCGTGECI